VPDRPGTATGVVRDHCDHMARSPHARIVAVTLVVAAIAPALTSCSSTGDEAPATAGNAATQAASLADRVAGHLLANGARTARAHHPGNHWFRGSLVLPAGGATCAIASIATGAHGPLVTDAVFDASGMVSVRVRAADRDRERCLAAARRALATFDAGEPGRP
jgi:hypothetical protein